VQQCNYSTEPIWRERRGAGAGVRWASIGMVMMLEEICTLHKVGYNVQDEVE